MGEYRRKWLVSKGLEVMNEATVGPSCAAYVGNTMIPRTHNPCSPIRHFGGRQIKEDGSAGVSEPADRLAFPLGSCARVLGGLTGHAAVDGWIAEILLDWRSFYE
jgi:hypothetical protein